MQRDYSGRPLRLFLTFYRPHRRLFALDLLFALLSCAADLAFPYVSRQAMQSLLPLGLFRTFFAVMAALLAAYLLKAVFKYAVTVIGHRKGSTLDENLACNFGMPGPEGYRKALRLMKQAEKFGRPIITFIDTPGAYPGKDAEERGQGEAIARNLMEMSGLTVPVIAVVTGEGSSGGALALGVANHILMLENAVYSVLSPEGFASILWKDASRSGEACEMMKLTAQDLYSDGIVEQVIPEPLGGAQRSHAALFEQLDVALRVHLKELCRMSGRQLADQRYKKYRQIGETRNA